MTTLDGSLIAFVALKLGLSCSATFARLAMIARPKAAADGTYVARLAEEACRLEMPDRPRERIFDAV